MRRKISRDRRSRVCSAETGDSLDGEPDWNGGAWLVMRQNPGCLPLSVGFSQPISSGALRSAGAAAKKRHGSSSTSPGGAAVEARRRPTCGRSASSAASSSMPRAPAWCASATPTSSAPRASTRSVPPWLRGGGKGWVTAEYGMLPRATNERTRREASAGKQSGRTLEIQRLIGRSLRAVVDLAGLGERQIIDRLRRHPGRRRHAHRGDHRRLGRAPRLHRMDARARHDRAKPVLARSRRRGLRRHLPRARRCSTSTMPRTAKPRPTRISS